MDSHVQLEIMNPNSIHYHSILADYFSGKPLYLDESTQKKPGTRKLVELPFQQTNAGMWDDVTGTLCDLEFIQAKAVAKMTYDLVRDFNDVLEVIPDNADNIRKEMGGKERMDKYNLDLISYAKGEIEKLEIPESITPWPQEKIDAECERIKNDPTRADRLKDFYNFLGHEAGNLQNYSHEFPHFVTQQAWNYAAEGPVGKAAERVTSEVSKSFLCRIRPTRPLWNPLPQALQVHREPTGKIFAISITPDRQRAISNSNDNTCILWDLATGQVLQTLRGHTDIVNDVSISADGLRAISASHDETCILWDLTTGEALQTLKGHTGWVGAVAITPDGQMAISGGSIDHTCILWDLTTGEALQTLWGHSYAIEAISITSDGLRAISGSQDNTCILWDLGGTGQTLQILRGHTGWVKAVAITPDGKKAISGSLDNTCILWDLTTGEALQTLRGHTAQVYTISITPDGQRAISGSEDMTCILWDLRTGQMMKILKGNTSEISAVSLTPDGLRAISGSSDGICILWDLETGQTSQTPGVNTSFVTAISITPDGKRAISGFVDNTCILWDLVTGQVLQTLKLWPDDVETNSRTIWNAEWKYYWSVNLISITPDGKRAISGSLYNTCILWDLTRGKELWRLERHLDYVRAISIAPDGQIAISASRDTTCILWDLWNRLELRTLKGHFGYVNDVSITPDGQRAISCSNDNTCILWDLWTGQALQTLRGHTSWVNAVSITPDGKRVISGSSDLTCILWDLRTGQVLQILRGHADSVVTVSISPDGKRAISGSADKTCILWDLVTGKKLACYTCDSCVTTVKIYPNGILLGGQLGEIVIINVDKSLLCPGTAIITARQIWDFEIWEYQKLSADCPLCGHRFAPQASVLVTIKKIKKKVGLKPEQSPCLELPDKAWEEPGLLWNCSKCGGELKFNPFFAFMD